MQSGKEVTVHEKTISAYGWTGYGYTVIDPDTGAGGYLIDGKGNGGFLDWWEKYGTYVGIALALVCLVAAGVGVAAPSLAALPFVMAVLVALSVFVSIMNILTINLEVEDDGCPHAIAVIGTALEVVSLGFSIFGKVIGLAIGSFISFLVGGTIGGLTSTVCRYNKS